MTAHRPPRFTIRRNACAAGLMLGVLVYWASTMTGEPLFEFDFGLGSLISAIAPTAPSSHVFELA